VISGSGGAVLLALASSAAFGLSGSLARSLLDLGWSPAAVVTVRVSGAFAILLVPTLLLLRRIGLPSSRQSARMIGYGLVAVAGAQLCYFSAVQYVSVGVALLLEYLAPVLLIGWHWARHARRPTREMLAGAGLSLVGLALVLDVTSGPTINPIGVAWGLGAALGLCAYFVLSENRNGESTHPLLLTTAGTGIGGAAVALAGAFGFLPMAAQTGSTTLAGAAVPWWLPTLALIVISAVFAYLAGIVAVRRLGSSVASFVGLTEVIFAVAFAFVLLGQQPSPIQLVGGALVLAGITLVQRRRP
jgi:drug/metabolite transporter (DMT)-like permease